jgi:predicted naringenin-chalcone synthase
VSIPSQRYGVRKAVPLIASSTQCPRVSAPCRHKFDKPNSMGSARRQVDHNGSMSQAGLGNDGWPTDVEIDNFQRSNGDQTMSFAILGLGTALPPHTISQARAAEVAQVMCCRTEEDASVLPNLYRHTGIATRHMVFGDRIVEDVLQGTAATQCIFLPTGAAEDHGPSTRQRMEYYAQEAPPLALEAARRALDLATVSPGDLTHLVTVSCTGFAAPGWDVGLIKNLQLPATIQRTHVGFMGCHGAINGLRVAQAFTSASPAARVLLCAVELCSLHFHYGWDPKKMVANALFADGAAALVGAPGPAAAPDAWQAVATGSSLFPESEYAMTWHIGDHGFEMSLSTRVPSLIGTHLRPWLVDWLRQQGIGLDEVGSWAVHPGGPRILSAVEESLGLRPQALDLSRQVLAECGNMSSPTVLFILERLRDRHAPRPCVALGFGPGLVAEVALFL